MQHILRPGVWAWARLEREGPSLAHLRYWVTYTKPETAEVPNALQIFGTVIKTLQDLLGASVSDPERASHAEFAKVCCKPPQLLHGFMGGCIEAITVWPRAENPEHAEEVWKAAWPKIREELRKCGMLINVVGETTEEGNDFFEITYGPDVLLGLTLGTPDMVPRAPGIVDLGTVNMTRSRGAFTATAETKRPTP